MSAGGFLWLYHRSDVPLFCRLCVFQHALRLLAFGQLYKVLNMDPLPASKPSPRLLEGACRLVCALCFASLFVSLFLPFLNSFLSPLFRYSPGSINKNSMLRRHVRLSGQCDVLSARSFPLCRRLSEEAPGGHRVRRQRLHQKDERWLWPSTHPYRRITAHMIEILFLSLLRCSRHLGWYTWLAVALY